jgi:dihydrodipicolinate synthase/N-acetylneuraminate lyase
MSIADPLLRPFSSPSRRQFLRALGVGAAGLTLAGCGLHPLGKSGAAATGSAKALRGIFPIAQTPFTGDDKLDLESLAQEVKFIDRGRVHGFGWPQLASEWSTLTEKERFDGMEVIGSTGRKLRPAIVFGVQGDDIAQVGRYVKQAEKTGANAIISLPPSEGASVESIVSYYQEVGRMTDLPLFVQAVGNVNVDALVEMYRTIPTMRYVKDEAGDPLADFPSLQRQTSGQVKVFSGGHGRKLIDEMRIGFSGSMPAASLADLYVQTYQLYQEGKTSDAQAMHQRTLTALNQMLDYGMEGMKYVLHVRGVFKSYAARKPKTQSFTSAASIVAGGKPAALPVDDKGRKALDEMVQSLKPYLLA